jgi:hypothetical protein
MSSRPKRSSAIAALQKITTILKEAEKYDHYGNEIEVEPLAPITTSESINVIPVKPSEPINVVPEESMKTPNTLFFAANEDNEKYSSYGIYSSTLKSIHVENIKKYLNEIDKNNKYIVIPELMKYLIVNPSLMIHHSKFGEQVTNKMIEFENEMRTVEKIGNYRITEEYRKEFLATATILKKIASIYKKLNIHQEEFYDNIETIAKDF